MRRNKIRGMPWWQRWAFAWSILRGQYVHISSSWDRATGEADIHLVGRGAYTYKWSR